MKKSSGTFVDEPIGGGRFRLRLLTREEKEKIHEASLEILEKTGVHVFLPEAVDLLQNAGATVTDTYRVRIPPELVEESIQSAPSRILIGDRKGEEAMVLEGNNSYFGTGPTIQFVYDVYTGERRATDTEDIEKAALICDYLPNIDFVMTMGMTGGVEPALRGMNPEITDRYDFAALLSSTTKPIIISNWTVEGLSDIYDMALAVLGGDEAFRKAPLFLNFRQPVSPLQHDAKPLQSLLFCAEKGIPMIYASYPMMGATGPATLAGSVAMSNAEFLSGLVMSQLKRPGAPIIFSSASGPMDMKFSTTPYNAPEAYLGETVEKEMAAYYGMPNFSYGGLTDAKLLDEQAGVEAALSLFQAALTGSNLIHDVGYMDSGLTACWELIVLANDIIGHIKTFLRGCEVNDETLCLDVIDKVGPGGNFLMEDHTLNHFKEIWYPDLLDRSDYATWEHGGGRPLREVLNERVQWILENHTSERLPEKVREKVSNILKRNEDA